MSRLAKAVLAFVCSRSLIVRVLPLTVAPRASLNHVGERSTLLRRHLRDRRVAGNCKPEQGMPLHPLGRRLWRLHAPLGPRLFDKNDDVQCNAKRCIAIILVAVMST